MSASATIFIDGASQGNPGYAGIGVVIERNKKAIKRIAKFIGTATNNVAEYSALIYALQEALMLNIGKVTVYTDSQLLACQMNKEYKVKDANIRVLFELAAHVAGAFDSFSIRYIPREKNREADALATQSIREQALSSARVGKVVGPAYSRAGKSGLQRAAHPENTGTSQLTFLG